MSTFLLPIDGHDRYILLDALNVFEPDENVHGHEAVAELLRRLDDIEPIVNAEAREFVRYIRRGERREQG